MNLTLKVTKKENTNMSSLVKQMCTLKCRINVDSTNGNISIFDIDEDNNIENVIDSISEAFDIISIDIIPTVVPSELDKPVITEDSIELETLKFKDAEIQNQINDLLKTISRIIYSKKAKSHDICTHLISTRVEIAMKYNPNQPIKFSVGDIVDCNYGSNLGSEISGGHVHSVICSIEQDGLVYAVPITKSKFESDKAQYLQFSADVDIKYYNSIYTGGTVLLKMGKYINLQRCNTVVGHAWPEFFKKILMKLPTTIDFYDKYSKYENELDEKLDDVQNDDSMLSFENSEEQKNKKNETPAKEPKDKVTNMSAEDYLTIVLADALNSLDKSKPIEDQIKVFLEAIGLSNSERIMENSFVACCIVKKIGYESIILELHNKFPKIKEEIIKATLKNEFKKWLAKYPNVKEKYPKVSIMALLKIFAKKMS